MSIDFVIFIMYSIIKVILLTLKQDGTANMIKSVNLGLEEFIKNNFRFNHPELKNIFLNAIEKCILANVSPPEGVIKRMWISPGGYYTGHWIWDTMFVVDLLSFIPGHEEIIRDAFRIYWDSQDSWNAKTPEYAHWMVPNKVGKQGATPFSQSECIIAWAMERIYNRTGDEIIVREGLERLEKYHDWYWRERDIEDIGLVGVGTYAPLILESLYNKDDESRIQSARFESFDYQPALDELKLTPHPQRHEKNAMYGTVYLPDATAFLIQAEESLIRLASAVGREDIAIRRRFRIKKGVKAMRQHMWDQDAGMFLSVVRGSMEKLVIPAVSGLIPLFAGVPTQAQADRMAKELNQPDWNTFLPVPTVARYCRYFNDGRHGQKQNVSMMWRGDVWNQLNLLLCHGLARYGYSDIADKICNRTVGNVIVNGFNECYNPDTGKGLRVQNLGMSCTAVTMLLDGFGNEYRLKPYKSGLKNVKMRKMVEVV